MSKYIDAEALKEKFKNTDANGISLAIDRYALKCIEDAPTIEVSEGNQVLYGNEHNCILTMFGECSYAETGCGDCAVAEKIRRALSVEVSEDCISRDWVLNRLTKYQKNSALNELDDWQNTVVEWITTDIEDAPSVVPKQVTGKLGDSAKSMGSTIEADFKEMRSKLAPTIEQSSMVGEWIEVDDGRVSCKCSICKEEYLLYEEDVFGRNYCPNCGAKMKGAE